MENQNIPPMPPIDTPPPPPPPTQQYQYQSPQQKKSNPIIKILIILIILFVIGGIISSVVGFFVARNYVSFFKNFAENIPQQTSDNSQNVNQNNNQNNNQTNPTNNTMTQNQSASAVWKTYKNDKFGYQLDYPSNFQIYDYATAASDTKDNFDGMILSVFTESGLLWQIVFAKGDSCFGFESAPFSDITISGIKGKKFKALATDEIGVEYICLNKGGYGYLLGLTTNGASASSVSNDEILLFEKMVSTFKIF